MDEARKRNLLRDPGALIIAARAELDRRRCKSLYQFVKTFWHVLEPRTLFVDGWVIEAICEHLEAVTAGRITRLLINVPPGSMKSLLANVFWPAWEWGPCGNSHLKYLSFSYAQHLTLRDNIKFRMLITCERYRAAWGADVKLIKDTEEWVTTSLLGFKLATSVGGVGTGERGNRILLDDPHNVSEGESEATRTSTVEWFRTAMSNRLNNIDEDAIIVVMQRVHDDDVSGFILDKLFAEYDHLMIPAEFEPERVAATSIGWRDPRTIEGESYWAERYSRRALAILQKTLTPFAYASQYQQRPEIKGAGILPREAWHVYENPDDPDDPKFKKFPPFAFMLASFDGAYSQKQEADKSAMSVWGFWNDPRTGKPNIMLATAWAERLTLHDAVQRIIKTSKKTPFQILLVEAKATGLSVQQEIVRMQADADWQTIMVDPSRMGDKVARAHSVAHILFSGMAWHPPYAWADKLVTECAQFPRGKHDDLVDTTTQAWRWFRDSGLLTIQQERDADILAGLKEPEIPLRPLYPSAR